MITLRRLYRGTDDELDDVELVKINNTKDDEITGALEDMSLKGQNASTEASNSRKRSRSSSPLIFTTKLPFPRTITEPAPRKKPFGVIKDK